MTRIPKDEREDAVIDWLIAERWDHKKTNYEKIAAEKDKVRSNFESD